MTRRAWFAPRTRAVVVGALAAVLAAGVALPAQAGSSSSSPIGPTDWPAYGHDARHSFAGVTSAALTRASVPSLAPAWFFPTGDAVTADPVVVGAIVYVGSWDGYFYAINRATGTLRWKYQLKRQPAVNPSPGNTDPRDITSDGGLVTASAWYQPASGGRPDLVLFAGGYTLYALNAATGALYWSHDYTGLPEQPPSPSTDSTRIFSSPVVTGNQVVVGISSDGGSGHRGYVVSANLNNGSQIWRFETDVDTTGHVLNDGCGGVWSSPSLDPVRGLVFVGVADCHAQATPPYHERVLALHALNGSPAWVFTPPRLQNVPAGADPACDFDFGATMNLGSPDPVTGAPTFLGIGGKDGSYYRIDPSTGALVWQSQRVVFGGSAGGFIGTTAYDGQRVYGATAIGDFGGPPCSSDATDTPVQDPSIHAFTTNGVTAWESAGAQSFGPTTVAAGVTFSGYAFGPVVQAHDASTGNLVTTLPVASGCFCGISVAGDGVFFGTGSPQQGTGDGVYAFTPLGAPPSA
jgi:polyvinyl alcohol dehydrogenase (cytochrome)